MRECLLRALNSPLAELTLPPELRELSAQELGRIAASGRVHDVQVIDVLRAGNPDLTAQCTDILSGTVGKVAVG